MQFATIQRILGLLLLLFSLTMLPPAAVGLAYGDGDVAPFLEAFFVIAATGAGIWWPVRRHLTELRLRDGFLIVALFWAVLGLAGAMPLYLSERPAISFSHALFESVSAVTTTGATLLVGLQELPHSILFYRAQLQFLGGMSIIVLAVAVLPMLGIGGLQLYRAEAGGPVKESKLTPRITETAKALWYIYLGLTVACGTAYWLAGMSVFDALCHAFTTVATAGFSNYDASIGHFDNRLIESIAVVFMLLGGVNFSLHYFAARRLSVGPYLADAEFRAYILLYMVATLVTVGYLYWSETFPDPRDALQHGLFQVISVATTTGYTTAEFFIWPAFLPVMLLFLSFVGGCAGSTSGGMKVLRWLLLLRQGRAEVQQLIHPQGRIAVKIGGRPVPQRVAGAIWGFFAAYVLVFSLMMLVLMAMGLDQVTAFSAVAACINNLGPGLGEVGANYALVTEPEAWVLSFAMLLGRLEIFTLLVLLSGSFWRS